jgi:hypothetical protein
MGGLFRAANDFTTPGAVKSVEPISGCGLVRDVPMGRQRVTSPQIEKKFFSKTVNSIKQGPAKRMDSLWGELVTWGVIPHPLPK